MPTPTEKPSWSPQPGPQTALLECPVEDCFYGGARFGGKTDGLLGDWAKHARQYGSDARGALFRRTYPELEEVERRLREAFAKPDEYNATTHTWTLPNGATLKLRYLDVDADADRYIGHQHTWLGFDQLEQWPAPAPIDKLWGTLRSAAGVPCVRRSTGNPGGPGHQWVKRRYIDPFPRGYRSFQYCPQPEVAPHLSITAVFIPAKLEDNLFAQRDPNYEARLAAAGSAALYRAWRHGDWDAIVGAVFDEWRQDLHVVQRDLRVPRSWRWAAGLDWGYRAPGCFVLFAAGPDGDVLGVEELYFRQQTAQSIGQAIGRLCQRYPVEYIAGDEQMWYKTGTSAPTIAEELQKGIADCYATLEGCPKLIEATHGRGSRVTRVQLLHRYLAWTALPDGVTIPPWGQPRLRFLARCKACVRTIPSLPYDPTHPEDVDTDAEDHAYDAVTAYLMSRPPLAEREDVPPPREQHPGLDKRGKRRERVAQWERHWREQERLPSPFAGFHVPRARDLEPLD